MIVSTKGQLESIIIEARNKGTEKTLYSVIYWAFSHQPGFEKIYIDNACHFGQPCGSAFCKTTKDTHPIELFYKEWNLEKKNFMNLESDISPTFMFIDKTMAKSYYEYLCGLICIYGTKNVKTQIFPPLREYLLEYCFNNK